MTSPNSGLSRILLKATKLSWLKFLRRVVFLRMLSVHFLDQGWLKTARLINLLVRTSWISEIKETSMSLNRRVCRPIKLKTSLKIVQIWWKFMKTVYLSMQKKMKPISLAKEASFRTRMISQGIVRPQEVWSVTRSRINGVLWVTGTTSLRIPIPLPE